MLFFPPLFFGGGLMASILKEKILLKTVCVLWFLCYAANENLKLVYFICSQIKYGFMGEESNDIGNLLINWIPTFIRILKCCFFDGIKLWSTDVYNFSRMQNFPLFVFLIIVWFVQFLRIPHYQLLSKNFLKLLKTPIFLSCHSLCSKSLKKTHFYLQM